VVGPAPLRHAAAAAAIVAAALALAGCASAPAPTRPGGFYQDDGPPEAAVDLSRVPDAVPRVEPFHPFANRPYAALGRSFTPITDDRPFRQRGIASWYGRQFHGNRTASGERYDMMAMTAAHPTLPIPSYVRVTHLRNGASVIVRVNDRGPFKHGRVIDLSYAAALRLGIAAAGTGEVEVVRFTHADIRAGRTGATVLARDDAGPERPPARPASPRAPLPPPASALEIEPVAAPVAMVGGSETPAGRWSVQLGAFAVAANAIALRERVALLLAGSDGALAAEARVRVERDGAMHRVLAGAFAEREAAARLAARLERTLERDTVLHRH